MDVSEDELQSLYTWVDEIPLSRPKRNIARDFSDGVLVAEVVANFFPRAVELHNYSSANSMQQKLYNWNTLNNKVFRKLGFKLPKDEQLQCVNSVTGAIERVLKLLRIHIEQCQARGGVDTAPATFSTLVPAPTTGPAGSPTAAAAAAAAASPPPAGVLRGELPAASAAMAPILSSYLSGSKAAGKAAAAAEALAEKEQAIFELREMNEILETKVRKLEQLVKLKDAKIHTLMAKLQAAGLL